MRRAWEAPLAAWGWWPPGGGALILQGAKPVRLAAGAFLLCVRIVAGCAPCRVTPLTLGVTLQRSAAPPFPSGPRVPPGAPFQNALGTVLQDPLTLSCGWIRSQGACGAFYFWRSRDQIKNQPYKRRLAPDPGGRRPSGRGKWGPRKVARPCGERRMHRSEEGCPKQSAGSARPKRKLRPTSVGSLGRSPK